jgi:hypothetical protein
VLGCEEGYVLTYVLCYEHRRKIIKQLLTRLPNSVLLLRASHEALPQFKFIEIKPLCAKATKLSSQSMKLTNNLENQNPPAPASSHCL